MRSDTALSRDTVSRPEPSPKSARSVPLAAFDQRRRLNPRIWDADWLVLRGMRRAISSLAAMLCWPGAIALDFGCGSKPYESLFVEQGATYRGADFGRHAEIAIDADGKLAVADRSADLVLSFQVLEHVRDLDLYFDEARRVLNEDGVMILSTHGTWLYHPHPEDHRRWTREGLVNEIASRGFDVIDCVPVVGPLAWTTMLRLTCACYAFGRVPLLGRALSAICAVLMNLRALLEEAITPQWVTKDNACVYVTVSRPSATTRR
jgi:SAM-dependent methyltransferase